MPLLKIWIFNNSYIPDNIIQSFILENMLNIKYLYHEIEKSCVIGHRPVLVKRALIGSKGGWKLSTIFTLKSVSWLVKNKITGKYSYLLDGYIFAALFETAYHYFCWLSLLVWLRKNYLAFWYFFQWNFPLMKGAHLQGHKSGKGISYLFRSNLLFYGSLIVLKSCEDHSLLKS